MTNGEAPSASRASSRRCDGPGQLLMAAHPGGHVDTAAAVPAHRFEGEGTYRAKIG